MMYRDLLQFSYNYMKYLLYQKINMPEVSPTEIWHLAHTLKPLAIAAGNGDLLTAIDQIEKTNNSRRLKTEFMKMQLPDYFNLYNFFDDFHSFIASIGQIENKQTDYFIELHNNDEIMLPGIYLMPLFVIFTNTIYNSVFHAFKKNTKSNKIKIDIFNKNGYVLVRQRDNGAGIGRIDGFYSGFGAVSIEDEAHKMGAIFDIKTNEFEGTLIELKFRRDGCGLS